MFVCSVMTVSIRSVSVKFLLKGTFTVANGVLTTPSLLVAI